MKISMQFAKPSAADIDAAYALNTVLSAISRDDFPMPSLDKKYLTEDISDIPDCFDAEDADHLKALHTMLVKILDYAPGFNGRVISGMCAVIMYDKNKIIDPDSDVLELHPDLIRAIANEAKSKARIEQLESALSEAKSVISSINSGTQHRLRIDGDANPVYWQTEEWCDWARDEVLPVINAALKDGKAKEGGAL